MANGAAGVICSVLSCQSKTGSERAWKACRDGKGRTAGSCCLSFATNAMAIFSDSNWEYASSSGEVGVLDVVRLSESQDASDNRESAEGAAFRLAAMEARLGSEVDGRLRVWTSAWGATVAFFSDDDATVSRVATGSEEVLRISPGRSAADSNAVMVISDLDSSAFAVNSELL